MYNKFNIKKLFLQQNNFNFKDCNFSVNFNGAAGGKNNNSSGGVSEEEVPAGESEAKEDESADGKAERFLLKDNLRDKELEKKDEIVEKRNLEFSNGRFKLLKESELNWDLAEDEEENINDSENKFLPFKIQTLRLEEIYKYLGIFNRAEKLYNCSTYLWFELKRGQTIDKKKLKRINSCKLRLCPFCQWRKSLKTFANIFKCVQEIEKLDRYKDSNEKSRFVAWTLTTENVELEALSDEIDRILKGFDILRRRKDFKNAFEGYIRSVEVVVDREREITLKRFLRAKDYYVKRRISVGDLNSNYMKCNVHIHILLHTRYNIYTGGNYITQEKLTKIWQSILDLDYKPIVWVESFKTRNRVTKGKELAEFAKYVVKSNNYLRYDCSLDKDSRSFIKDKEFLLDAKVIFHLDEAMASRRLFAMGGSFRKISKELKLDYENFDSEDFSEELDVFVVGYYFDFVEKFYLRKKI